MERDSHAAFLCYQVGALIDLWKKNAEAFRPCLTWDLLKLWGDFKRLQFEPKEFEVLDSFLKENLSIIRESFFSQENSDYTDAVAALKTPAEREELLDEDDGLFLDSSMEIFCEIDGFSLAVSAAENLFGAEYDSQLLPYRKTAIHNEELVVSKKELFFSSAASYACAVMKEYRRGGTDDSIASRSMIKFHLLDEHVRQEMEDCAKRNPFA